MEKSAGKSKAVVGRSLRNAAMVLASAVGRFGDTKRPDDIPLGEVKGVHKFKKNRHEKPDESDGVPDVKFTIEPLPKNYTFREWHNYWRQFLRRGFKSRVTQGNRGLRGKTALRHARRQKVAAMNDRVDLRADVVG